MDEYFARWLALFNLKNGSREHLVIYNDLRKRYDEKHRHYHNFNHIADCLRHVDGIKRVLQNPFAVETALWFHDAVYSTISSKNEQKSAEFAIFWLKKLNIEEKVIDLISNLILVTKHPGIPRTEYEKYILDIDLAILGEADPIFTEYENNVRCEFSWVPWFIYKKQRIKLLKSILDQDKVYKTEVFFKERELIARANIQSSLKKME